MGYFRYLNPFFCVTSFVMRNKERQKSGIRILVTGCLIGLSMFTLHAQTYKMELGLAAGPSFYMGDANQQRLFDNRKSSWNLLYRYNLNGRFALKGTMGLTGVAGTTAGSEFNFPAGTAISFERNLLDATAQLEMNFFEYGMPDYVPGSAKVTPYISAGVGLAGFRSDKVEATPILPFGVGLKVKVFDRFNLGCEWSFRSTFTDRLDYSSNIGGFQLEDPWLVESSRTKNKDWYSLFTLNLSVDLFATQAKCFR